MAAGEQAKTGTGADKGATVEQHAQSAAGNLGLESAYQQQEETTSFPAQQQVWRLLLKLAGFPM